MAKTDGRLARGQERRELLLDSSVAVVAAGGAGALTHRAVAAQAGVSLASVTYHFPQIGDLRSGMFDHAGTRVGSAFRALVETSDPGDVAKLAADYAVLLVRDQRDDTVAVFEMIVAATHDPTLRPLVRFFNDRLADLLVGTVGDRFSALVVASAIQGLILGYCTQEQETDFPALHEAVSDLVARYSTTAKDN